MNIELTNEEALILQHYALGRTRKQIGELMNYAHGALSKLCSELKKKLFLENETQLIIYAHKQAEIKEWSRW